MTQTRLTLDSHCIVVNNAGKADDITARRHSLTFHQVVTDAVPGYVKLFESLKPTSKEGKAKIKTYIDQNILANQVCMEKTFVWYHQKNSSFEVLDKTELISAIKKKLLSSKNVLKQAKAKAEAKSRREIVTVLPLKYVLKKSRGKSKLDDLQLLLHTMKEVSAAYYSVSSTRGSGLQRKEYEAKLQKIRKQVYTKVRNEGYVFIEEDKDGKLTKMSDDEVDAWIANLYVSKRDNFATEKKPRAKQISQFDATEDTQIITFGQQSISDGFSFTSIPWDMLASQMKERNRASIAERAEKLLNNDGSVRSLLSNDGKEWSEEEDKILHDARIKGEPDLKALSSQLDRSERLISARMGKVTFNEEGNRITRATVSESILSNQERAKEYLGKAKLKPEEELSERQILTGCQIHAHGRRQGRNGKNLGYSQGIGVEMMDIRVTGPPLHQAAATVGSGPRPAPITVSGKKRKADASHLCKDSGCTNPKHLKWEDHRANMHRNTCVGMIKFDVGGKSIMVPTKECTCNAQCLNYVSAM